MFGGIASTSSPTTHGPAGATPALSTRRRAALRCMSWAATAAMRLHLSEAHGRVRVPECAGLVLHLDALRDESHAAVPARQSRRRWPDGTRTAPPGPVGYVEARCRTVIATPSFRPISRVATASAE